MVQGKGRDGRNGNPTSQRPNKTERNAMKRMLITFIAAGTLAVPAGIALAQDDTPEPTEPVPTCEQHERARARVNQQMPAADHGQHRAENQRQLGDAPCAGDCDGTEAQNRNQIRVEDGAGDGICDGDCTGDQVRNRTQVEPDDQSGVQRQSRNPVRAG